MVRNASALLFVSVLWIPAISPTTASDWPGWRGPESDGTSPEIDLPLKWGHDENVAWKVEMPSRSGATPAVVGDCIYISVSQDPEKSDELTLWSLDRRIGKVLWKRSLGGGNTFLRKHHLSSPSPVSDGERVWVVTGTGVVASFDRDGHELWRRELQKDYGAFGLKWGYSSSPVLWHGDLLLQVLHGMETDDPSYLLRLDGKTGETRWKVERPEEAIGKESPDAYGTPVLWQHGEVLDLVVVGADVFTGHDLETGLERWRRGGLNPKASRTQRLVASPLVSDDLLLTFAKRGPTLASRSTDESGPEKVWESETGTDVPTPVSDGKLLYIINDKGHASALDLATGENVYGPHRLAIGTYSSSPVLADGKIYITDEEARTTVIQAGSDFKVLAENQLEGFTLSTPAISHGQIFIRTARYLYAIGKERE